MSDTVKLRISFLIVLAGMFGSLFFSELMKLPPCSLCWYQRVAMYPLVLIFGIAIWSDDPAHRRYSFPLIIAGLLISAYHNLLYYGVISEALAPCTQDLSCTKRQLEMMGFITIPLLSLLSFVALFGLNLKLKKQET